MARSPSTASSSRSGDDLNSLFGDDASDNGSLCQALSSPNDKKSSSLATTPTCSPPHEPTKEIPAEIPAEIPNEVPDEVPAYGYHEKPARGDGDLGFGFLGSGRAKIHDDEVDLDLDLDSESDDQCSVDTSVDSVSHGATEMTEAPTSEPSETHDIDEEFADFFATEDEHGDRMNVAPADDFGDPSSSGKMNGLQAAKDASEVQNENEGLEEAFDDFFEELDENGKIETHDSVAHSAERSHHEDANPDTANQGENESLEEAFEDYWNKHGGCDENDEQVIDDSSAHSAGRSHHENAFLPPSLPRGDSHIPNGNAVSTFSSSPSQAPSPQAPGGFDKTPEQNQRMAAKKTVRKAAGKAPSKVNKGQGQENAAIDGDPAVHERGERIRQARRRAAARQGEAAVHAREQTPDFGSSAPPRMYHRFWRNKPDFKILVKHLDLHGRADFKDCYLSLGLDRHRGQGMVEKIRKYLQTPGNSVRVDASSTDDWKLQVAKISHDLLVTQRWGILEFDRPALNLPRDKQVRFAEDSTKIFLDFAKLFYRVAKGEDRRRRAKAKRREADDSGFGAVEQGQPVPKPNSNAEDTVQPRQDTVCIDLTDDTDDPAPGVPFAPQQPNPIDLTSDADEPAPTVPLPLQKHFTPAPPKQSAPQLQADVPVFAAAAASTSRHQKSFVESSETDDPFLSPRLLQQQQLYPQPALQYQPPLQAFYAKPPTSLHSSFEQLVPRRSQQVRSQPAGDFLPQTPPQRILPQTSPQWALPPQPQEFRCQSFQQFSPPNFQQGMAQQFRPPTPPQVMPQAPQQFWPQYSQCYASQAPSHPQPHVAQQFSPRASRQATSHTPHYPSPRAAAQYQGPAQAGHFSPQLLPQPPPRAPRQLQEPRAWTPPPPQQPQQPQPEMTRGDPLLKAWLVSLTPEQNVRVRAAGMRERIVMFAEWKIERSLK